MKILAKAGFRAYPPKNRGSHVFLRHSDGRTTVVPLHDEISRGLLEESLPK